MIKIKVTRSNNLVKEIEIKGHANHEDFGKDIVCASVSTMATTVINNILALDNDAITYDVNDAYILISNKDSKIANTLLNNMLKMLKELANDYPKNISIEEEI